MRDYLVRATTAEASIIGIAAITTNLVEEARRRHDTYPTATGALGRVLTGGALLGSLLKEKEHRLTIQILSKGPLKEIMVEADGEGNVRGYVQRPHIHIPSTKGKLEVGTAVGKDGFLYVVKDLGLKEPYRGTVPLVSGEIAKDLAYYLTASEQIPSAVALGVYVEKDSSVKAAGGFIIQSLPSATEEVIGKIEKNLKDVPPCSQLVMEGKSPEEILERALQGFSLKIHERRGLRFRCRCSRRKVESTLIALGEKELEDMLVKDEKADVHCDFCGAAYLFSREDLERLLKELRRKKKQK